MLIDLGEPAEPARILTEDEFRQIALAFGGAGAFHAERRELEANREYVEAHRERLRRDYPDECVGIVGQEVRAHGETADEVMESLRESGEDLTGVLLHHAWVEEPTWVL